MNNNVIIASSSLVHRIDKSNFAISSRRPVRLLTAVPFVSARVIAVLIGIGRWNDLVGFLPNTRQQLKTVKKNKLL